ncbi:hypothetical protein T492DRAFT_1063912 [Pavlovales sp. CCMP2436]|nr:hypothetical protein T492DRAFT_1063912 [Pavlovales sp. CCMP2436]
MLRVAISCLLLAAEANGRLASARGLRTQPRPAARVLSTARAQAVPCGGLRVLALDALGQCVQPRSIARVLSAAPRAAFCMANEPVAEQPAVSEAEPTPPNWLRRQLAKAKFDKASLRKLGGSMILSYGFVSNVNAAILIIISWATFRRANPLLSPLAFSATAWFPIMSKSFLVTYGTYYATIGTLLRPVRFVVATALAPSFTRVANWLKERLGLSPAAATAVVVLVANFVGTWFIIVVGVRLACLAVGLPVFPPGFVLFPPAVA